MCASSLIGTVLPNVTTYSDNAANADTLYTYEVRAVNSNFASAYTNEASARTIQSPPESGADAGYDGYKRRKGRKVHTAVDPLGHLLALVVTPANAQERAQVAKLAAAVQDGAVCTDEAPRDARIRHSQNHDAAGQSYCRVAGDR